MLRFHLCLPLVLLLWLPACVEGPDGRASGIDGDLREPDRPLTLEVSGIEGAELTEPAEADGHFELAPDWSDGAGVVLWFGGAGGTTGLSVDLGTDPGRLDALLAGEVFDLPSPPRSAAEIVLDSGEHVLRDLVAVSFDGTLDEGALTVHLGDESPVLDGGSRVGPARPAPPAQLVFRGRFDIVCSPCILTDSGGTVCGSSPEIDAWCTDARAQFGLE